MSQNRWSAGTIVVICVVGFAILVGIGRAIISPWRAQPEGNPQSQPGTNQAR